MAGTPQQIMSGFRLDLGPLKEPLGFIRVLEWVFSIFAFATTGGYTGTTSFTVNCQKPVSVEAKFAYPFRLPSYGYDFPNCSDPDKPMKMFLQNDYSSSAEFFVCIGVFGFLYCTATLVLYLGYQHVYRETSRGPMIDLALTALFAFMWLVSSSAWGKGLTDVKSMTNPDNLVKTIDHCTKDMCTAGTFPAMGRLNASVISGFLNLILWGSNCWFIYKETPFHKPNNPPVSVGEETGP
ncbi:synaptophysin-like protein 2a [Anguilla anguilla]|uniref:synaptophysin-like protein 2a n=1 Tax=Anguilla anguilla TaxID=7936 RepID=UPI0015B1D340|nr:synaptophysin-like protein 2a [Anguilla anguilla]